MPLPRVRFTSRRIMVATAIVALLAAGASQVLRQPGGPDPLLLPTAATGALVGLAAAVGFAVAAFGLGAVVARARVRGAAGGAGPSPGRPPGPRGSLRPTRPRPSELGRVRRSAAPIDRKAKGVDSMRTVIAGLALAGLMFAVSVTASGRPESDRAEAASRPFLALWQQSNGRLGGSGLPYLRFALWADGRAVFAEDPAKWGGELRRGHLAAARVTRLRAALSDTGIFDLKGTCYLVPDAPVDCLLVDLGGEKRQMLFWDEVEAAGYGINIDPKPRHLEFKRCWKVVNHLALVAIPDDGVVVKERVEVPESWYIKPMVQSE